MDIGYYHDGCIAQLTKSEPEYYNKLAIYSPERTFVWQYNRWSNTPTLRVQAVRQAILDGVAREITDGFVPVEFLRGSDWLVHVNAKIDGFWIGEMRVNPDHIRRYDFAPYLHYLEYELSNQPLAELYEFILHTMRDRWTVTPEQYRRFVNDGTYRHYRLRGGEVPLNPSVALLTEKFRIGKRELARMYNEATDNTHFRDSIYDVVWKTWTTKYTKAYNRNRRFYVMGEATDFRLSEEYPSWRNVDDVHSILMEQTPEALVQQYSRRLAGKVRCYNTALPNGRADVRLDYTDQGGSMYRVKIEELHTQEGYEQESEFMGHCIGRGGYFGTAAAYQRRAFHITINSRSHITVMIEKESPDSWAYGTRRFHIISMSGKRNHEMGRWNEVVMDALRKVMPEWVTVENLDAQIKFE